MFSRTAKNEETYSIITISKETRAGCASIKKKELIPIVFFDPFLKEEIEIEKMTRLNLVTEQKARKQKRLN